MGSSSGSLRRLAAACLWVLAMAAPVRSSGPMLRLENVPIAGLGDVSFEVGRAERVAILGPSGAGKSTLLRLISGLDRPNGGVLMVDGQDVGTLSPDALDELRRRKIGVLTGVGALGDGTVGEIVATGILIGGLSPRDIEAKVGQALGRVRLSHLARSPLGELSGGERQRVAIARALVHEPALLICDEPTAGLDPRSGLELVRALSEVGGETAVVVMTHSAELMRGWRTVTLGASGYRR